ncbi:MAG: ankyrin repeat domain-containing protein, partial [Candidatus Solibacter usitatus]|nr:ankyrin repeat domain-containing protein [Candidatus Solibacter usitatus]
PQADGTTALHWAAHQEDLETAELLVRAGANVKAANRYGVTPLSLACTNGNGAMVDLLLKAGADPNTSLPGGETALMTAARAGKVEAVKSLLSHKADGHAQESRRGQTALMWAAAEGHVEVVEALIQAGADFRARLDSGFTPLLFAVREGQAGVVRVLLKAGADVNETIQTRQTTARRLGYRGPRAGTSALMLAVGNAHYELAASLLDAGADPNASGPAYTALHIVSWVRKPGGGDNDPAPRGSGNMTSLEIVKKLVAKGAKVNARMTRKVNVGLTSLNTLGATPFLLAARTADAELMRALAALGADPLLSNADNSTPLMAAAGLGTRSPGEDAGTESEVVEALQTALDLGADLNAVDNNGETAMHGAAYKNLPAAVQFLADKGARIEVWNRKNKFGWTPLTIAEGHRFGNFKPSPETVAVFRRVMSAAGVAPDVEPSAVRSGTR